MDSSAVSNQEIITALATFASNLSDITRSRPGFVSPVNRETNPSPGSGVQNLPPVQHLPPLPGIHHLPSPERHALQVLPSYLKRKGKFSRAGSTVDSYKKKTKSTPSKSWDRDVFLLPFQDVSCISYPRGKYRAKLANFGLIGKLHMTSEMSDDDVADEIRTIFTKQMNNNLKFPFVYLQPTGGGSNSLAIPSQSSSFKWSPGQVAKLSGQSGIIYILALDKLSIEKDDSNSDSGSDFEVDQEDRAATSYRDNTLNKSLVTESSKKYLDIIDLTHEKQSSESGDSVESSDFEDFPVVSMSVNSNVDNKKCDLISLKHIILQHKEKFIRNDNLEVQHIRIRRSYLFEDAFRQFSKKNFDASKCLKVMFIGEDAEDGGGPQREFFHLLIQYMLRTSFFAGFPDNVIPSHNVTAVSENKYYIFGKMLAACIIHGGEAPTCFSKAVADFFVFEKVKSHYCIEDIPDVEIQEFLRKVLAVTTTEDFVTLLCSGDMDNFRQQCGYTKLISKISLDDKEPFIRAIWLHYVFFQPHTELQQMRRGLYHTLSFDRLAALYASEMWHLFVPSDLFEVTPEFFCNSFDVRYSPEKSNQRMKEESIIVKWYEYIEECATRSDVTLRDVLAFITGAPKLPAFGFIEHPKIYFTDNHCLPLVSTCDLSITFPRELWSLKPDEFFKKIDFCICNSIGFGKL